MTNSLKAIKTTGRVGPGKDEFDVLKLFLHIIVEFLDCVLLKHRVVYGQLRQPLASVGCPR